ncbi:MAG: hypothetical protein JW803_08425 [Endomicrobiales bacterium]|nr:hypothetical protein [Endomicrobiales bacterium]
MKTLEKRKRLVLSREESDILKWIYLKTLLPVTIIIVLSSIVLYAGLQYLMRNIAFTNYGVLPGGTIQDVSRFIKGYIGISAANVFLMIALSVVVMYLVIQNLVMPVMRVTRELRKVVETNMKSEITVRNSDKLLVPLVAVINRLIR